MSNQNVISIASRTQPTDRTTQQDGKAMQRVVYAKHIFDRQLGQMQVAKVRDLVAERHAKQILRRLNSILGYDPRS